MSDARRAALTPAEERVRDELNRRFSEIANAPVAPAVLRYYHLDHLVATPAVDRRVCDLAVAVHRIEAVIDEDRASLPEDVRIVSDEDAHRHPGFLAFESEILDEESDLLRMRAVCRGVAR